MPGFFYFWGSHTATVTGSATRHVRCCECDTPFEYQITRRTRGGGHSPFLLNPRGAAASAKERAYANLNRELRDSVEPVYCPTCGVFQPEMTKQLRRQFGPTYDPNEFAAERIVIPFREAWRRTIMKDTSDAYKHFIEVWPTASTSVAIARARIKELTRSPLVNASYKLFSILLRLGWLTIVLMCVGLVAVTIFTH